MKKAWGRLRTFTINTLSTTALTVLIMCLVAAIQGFTLWGVTVPFEMLLVNLLMHIGFYFVHKIDFKYFILSFALDLIYVTGLIIGFGFLFDWFHANTIWIICLVGAVVYIFGILIDVWRINREVGFINEKLKSLRGDKE